MAPDSTPVWKGIILTHVQHLKHCVKTENFTYLHVSKAVQVSKAASITPEIFSVTGSDTIEFIKQINEADAQDKQVVMGEFTNGVDKLKDQQPPADEERWKQTIREQAEKAKKRSNDGIDATADLAIQSIEKLPKSEQEPAANVFVTASNYVMDVVETLVQQCRVVFENIVNYLKGIWNSIKAAYDVVVGGVKSAIGFIKGLFGAGVSAFKELQDGAGPDPGPPTIHYFFNGRLNWPAAVTIMAATAGLTYVTDFLISRKNIHYDQQQTQLADGTIRTRTRIYSKDSNSLVGDVEKQLELAWTEAVATLGSDGHWIPAESDDSAFNLGDNKNTSNGVDSVAKKLAAIPKFTNGNGIHAGAY